MKRPIILILALSLAFMTACKNDASPGSIDAVFQNLSRGSGYEELKTSYTRGTISAIEDAASAKGITPGQMLKILPRFDSGAEWDEVSRKIDGDSAMVRIRFTRHPVENMVGLVMNLNLKKEQGSWKIDLENQVREVFSPSQTDAPAEYLRKLGKVQ